MSDPAEHGLFQTMICWLLYLSCWSRPDISFAVSGLSRFVSNQCQQHILAVKHLLRYLNGTKELSLTYSKPTGMGPTDKVDLLWGYVDSDWADFPDSRKSTSGSIIIFNADVSSNSK